jgi:hypothetical protein
MIPDLPGFTVFHCNFTFIHLDISNSMESINARHFRAMPPADIPDSKPCKCYNSLIYLTFELLIAYKRIFRHEP